MRGRAVVLVTLLPLVLAAAACGGKIAPEGQGGQGGGGSGAGTGSTSGTDEGSDCGWQYGIPCDYSVSRNASSCAVQCICVGNDRSTNRWTCFDLGCDEG